MLFILSPKVAKKTLGLGIRFLREKQGLIFGALDVLLTVLENPSAGLGL